MRGIESSGPYKVQCDVRECGYPAVVEYTVEQGPLFAVGGGPAARLELLGHRYAVGEKIHACAGHDRTVQVWATTTQGRPRSQSGYTTGGFTYQFVDDFPLDDDPFEAYTTFGGDRSRVSAYQEMLHEVLRQQREAQIRDQVAAAERAKREAAGMQGANERRPETLAEMLERLSKRP